MCVLLNYCHYDCWYVIKYNKPARYNTHWPPPWSERAYRCFWYRLGATNRNRSWSIIHGSTMYMGRSMRYFLELISDMSLKHSSLTSLAVFSLQLVEKNNNLIFTKFYWFNQTYLGGGIIYQLFWSRKFINKCYSIILYKNCYSPLFTTFLQ